MPLASRSQRGAFDWPTQRYTSSTCWLNSWRTITEKHFYAPLKRHWSMNTRLNRSGTAFSSSQVRHSVHIFSISDNDAVIIYSNWRFLHAMALPAHKPRLSSTNEHMTHRVHLELDCLTKMVKYQYYILRGWEESWDGLCGFVSSQRSKRQWACDNWQWCERCQLAKCFVVTPQVYRASFPIYW